MKTHFSGFRRNLVVLGVTLFLFSLYCPASAESDTTKPVVVKDKRETASKDKSGKFWNMRKELLVTNATREEIIEVFRRMTATGYYGLAPSMVSDTPPERQNTGDFTIFAANMRMQIPIPGASFFASDAHGRPPNPKDAPGLQKAALITNIKGLFANGLSAIYVGLSLEKAADGTPGFRVTEVGSYYSTPGPLTPSMFDEFITRKHLEIFLPELAIERKINHQRGLSSSFPGK